MCIRHITLRFGQQDAPFADVVKILHDNDLPSLMWIEGHEYCTYDKHFEVKLCHELNMAHNEYHEFNGKKYYVLKDMDEYFMAAYPLWTYADYIEECDDSEYSCAYKYYTQVGY